MKTMQADNGPKHRLSVLAAIDSTIAPSRRRASERQEEHQREHNTEQKKKRMRLFDVMLAIVAVAALGAADPSQAQARKYAVEIIAFDYLDFSGLDEEFWDEDPAEPSPVGTIVPKRAVPGAALRRGVHFIVPSNLVLNNEFRRLRQSKNFRPLLHSGWLVSAPSSASAAQAVWIGERPALADDESGGVVDGAIRREKLPDPNRKIRPAVRGTVKISRSGRYLLVELDLIYDRLGDNPPPLNIVAADIADELDNADEQWLADGGDSDDGDPNAQPDHQYLLEDGFPTRYRLIARRRVSPQRLHFFDHPLFGVLMKIK
ncbi:CsiV family protein [Thioalkalivibrio sp. HK1]|uniref:CsiV family protein n=1 Tax=Thioalkalivibrio sp. HK1 TaxID=1469245 RepID=UPI0004700C95|nr:CsiV family protein [Thioalkalivibrio sp. HK1]